MHTKKNSFILVNCKERVQSFYHQEQEVCENCHMCRIEDLEF